MSSPTSSFALNAPLTPRSQHQPSPGRRAAISEAFEAVKLDDETALYQAFAKAQQQNNNNSNNNTSHQNNHQSHLPSFDCNSTEPRNPKETSLLHWATYLNSEACFELLLSYPSINVDAEEIDGKTPLHYAAFQGNRDFVLALRDAGAIMVKPDQLGQTPCHLARMNGKEEVAKLFPNYRQVLQQSLAPQVHADANFVPGADGMDVLESFASPQSAASTNYSPRLLRNNGFPHNLPNNRRSISGNEEQQQKSNNSNNSRSPEFRSQYQQNLVDPSIFASPFSTFKSPHLKPRNNMVEGRRSNSNLQQQQHQQQQQQMSPSQINHQNSKKKDSFADLISSPFQNSPTADKNLLIVSGVSPEEKNGKNNNSLFRQESEERQIEDPGLRENSEELRQLAADEANLAAMEQELELEETTQRIAQAQVAWLEGVKNIAKHQKSLRDNQLSERLWELCTSIESSFGFGNNNNNNHNNGDLLHSDLEEQASQQLRTVTTNVERVLMEKRAKDRQIPVVSFRWTSSSYQYLAKPQQMAETHNISAILSPLSSTNNDDGSGPTPNKRGPPLPISMNDNISSKRRHHQNYQQQDNYQNDIVVPQLSSKQQQQFRSSRLSSARAPSGSVQSQIASIHEQQEPEPKNPYVREELQHHHHHHHHGNVVHEKSSNNNHNNNSQVVSSWRKPPPQFDFVSPQKR